MRRVLEPTRSRAGAEWHLVTHAASVPNYTKYSDGLKKLSETGFVWTQENLDKLIADPKAILPVAFRGIPDAKERADIIAYLKAH